MATKEQLLTSLDNLANQMITDRNSFDVKALKELLSIAYDDMTTIQRYNINHPHRGAYNASDRNRVSQYCDTLVEIMSEYYGTNTPRYDGIDVDWDEISDPDQYNLKFYIKQINIFKTFWCNTMGITDNFQISDIYYGISLATANNIERAIMAIHRAVNAYIFSMDSRYCGQAYGGDANSMLACGLSLQNDTGQYGIWTGAN